MQTIFSTAFHIKLAEVQIALQLARKLVLAVCNARKLQQLSRQINRPYADLG